MYGFAERQSAQALVEFALVLPVMLILVLGSVDIGRALVYGVAVQNGAREAGRLAASTAANITVTDTAVLQRLIDASAPALGGCAPISTLQQCGGGKWTFTLEDVTTDPVTLLPRTYTNQFNDGDDGQEPATVLPETGAAEYARMDPNFSGSKLRVTATGSVSMFDGIATLWGMRLFPITARGETFMVVL
jgi:Flp pilus assembly protein TadG